MSTLCRLALVIVIGLNVRASAATIVNVAVTAVAGRSVYIDHGRDAGIAAGTRVTFTPAGAAAVEGVVADVSRTTSRVDLIGSDILPLGTQGKLEVPDLPAPKIPAPQPTTRPSAIPAHPPWAPQEERTPDMPLLASASSRSPAERPWTLRGRIYTNFFLTLDRGESRDHHYIYSRTGTALTLTNPFRQGGEFRFDGEYALRESDVGDTADDQFRIKRFSYTIGTERWAPYHLELGRFSSYYLPEIGYVDGVEGAVRFEDGISVGGGLGGYPRPFYDQDTGEDLGFHLFAEYATKDPMKFSGTVGYQRTWRDHEPDRDLLIAHASSYLTKSLWLYGSATLDIYSAANPVKSTGPEETSALLQARYTPDKSQGTGLLYSRYAWADIRGRDYPIVPLDLLREGRVDRLEWSIYHDIVTDLRPTLRLYYFDSDRANGIGEELDLDWTNIGGEPLDLHNAVFHSDGEYSDDWGLRSEANLKKGDLSLTLGYEFLRYTFPDTQTDSGASTRHTIRGSMSWQSGDWYYNVSLDRYFGDADDAYLLGTYIECRF